MKLLIICALIGLCVADKLPTFSRSSAPYAPSGWRPNGATLQLPGEQNGQVNVEITQENVQYAGQLSETTTQVPSNEYLPPGSGFDSTTVEYPEDTDALSVQGLPNSDSQSKFNGQYRQFLPLHELEAQKSNRQNNVQQNQQQQQFGRLRQPQQANIITRSGRIQAPPARILFGQLQQQPQQQKFVPQSQKQQQFEPQSQKQQQFVPQQQYGPPQPPQQQYGPPQTQYYPSAAPTPQPESEAEGYDGEEEIVEDGEYDESDGANIAVANAVSNGQYYILGQDNTLQRVVYMTSQTEDDRLSNGFTAQLRYAPVDPIRDPVYAFDAQGHLVKVYNK